MNKDEIIIEPYNPSLGEIISKIIIGLIIGLVIAFLIFIILIFVGSIFEEAFNNSGINTASTNNPLTPLILIIIGFICSFIGNIIISGIYNLLYPNKYYDLTKMFSLALTINVLVFFIFVWLYVLFFDNIGTLYYVLGFHIIFTIFITNSLIETLTNPNYAGVYIIGSAIGLCFSILIFSLFIKFSINEAASLKKFLITIPPILGYMLIPTFNSLWEKLYYRFYEMDNNFLYLPTLNEIMVNEIENDEINVE